MYSTQLLDHFFCPRWVGDIASPSAAATEGHPTCGDVVQIHLRVVDGAIETARFRTLGCAVAIAASDATCELVMGQTPAVAQYLHLDEVIAALGGIPPERQSCAAAPLTALRSALRSLPPVPGGGSRSSGGRAGGSGTGPARPAGSLGR